MFALEMTLLTGRYVATAYNDRTGTEWPPHPARLFSAMVATHCERQPPDSSERTALEWLERQGAPSITSSGASTREVVTVFVPVNDTSVLGSFEDDQERVNAARRELDEARREALAASGSGDRKASQNRLKKAEKNQEKSEKALREQFARAVAARESFSGADIAAAATLLPDQRGRQARTFPSVTPDEPIVTFQWPDAEPDQAMIDTLQRLCERVVRVGHSSSLVRLRVCDSPPNPTWVPDDLSPRHLRVPLRGQLARLESQFLLHAETQPRVLPALSQGYRTGHRTEQRSLPRGAFGDDWLVLELSGGKRRALPILATAHVAEGVRASLQSHCDDPIPEILSGHLQDGTPSQRPHLAIVPLPSVGAPHADGRILGLALVLPTAASRHERRAVYRALAAWEDASREPDSEDDFPQLRLVLGSAGEWFLRRVEDESRLSTLRAMTWCKSDQGERVWMSATPVALDRNPGDLSTRDPSKAAQAFEEAERTVALACERVDLPRPERVWVTRSAPLSGGERVQRFPRFPRESSKVQRVLVHAVLRFPEPVIGPVLLGAGRYRGLGLFRPIPADMVSGEPVRRPALSIPTNEGTRDGRAQR